MTTPRAGGLPGPSNDMPKGMMNPSSYRAHATALFISGPRNFSVPPLLDLACHQQKNACRLFLAGQFPQSVQISFARDKGSGT